MEAGFTSLKAARPPPLQPTLHPRLATTAPAYRQLAYLSTQMPWSSSLHQAVPVGQRELFSNMVRVALRHGRPQSYNILMHVLRAADDVPLALTLLAR